MLPGPATRAAWYVVSSWRNDRFSPTAPEGVPLLPKPVAGSVTLRSRTCNTVDQRPVLLRKAEGGGGRNARATSPRLRALSGVPPAIHPRESPAAAGSAAIIRKPRNSHVSLSTLSARSLRLARQKTSLVVQKLWTMIFFCGRRRKNKS